ncbi:hypothetical protein PENSPDRAFT_651896 [Peniophora sp. CONT]|nr:hypothetical protein PENSPDRAFT_651896 [Peniophora sp. CONT]
MDAPHSGDGHGGEHPVANDDRSVSSREMNSEREQHHAESPPPYTSRDEAGYTGSDDDDDDDAATSAPEVDTGTQLDRTQIDKNGKGTERGRGLVGKLKKLEDKLIGTEEERSHERAERERKVEEENERQRAAYQQQLKRQQEFYAERDARQQQSGRVAADAGHEFRGFGDWYE